MKHKSTPFGEAPPSNPHFIASLSTLYAPSPSPGETTHWFTTEEIYHAVKSVDPGSDITKEQIHDAMLEAGYRYQPRRGSFGLEFRWMLREI